MCDTNADSPTASGAAPLLAIDAALLREIRSDMLDFMEERKSWWKSKREGKGEWYDRMQTKVGIINSALIDAGHPIG